MKKLSVSMVILLTGGSANISGGSDYTKYIQSPEQRISYQIAYKLHDNTVKDEQYALTRLAIDSIKNIKPCGA